MVESSVEKLIPDSLKVAGELDLSSWNLWQQFL
jgi:hypothetical protein